MKTFIKDFFSKMGYALTPINSLNDGNFAPDLSNAEKSIYEKVKPYTMTGLNSVVTLIQSVKYVIENNIEGDVVECGVWRGGCMMAVALTLNAEGGEVIPIFIFTILLAEWLNRLPTIGSLMVNQPSGFGVKIQTVLGAMRVLKKCKAI